MVITMNRLVGIYVGLTVATIATLAVLAGVAPRLATDEAWGHAVVVAAFAGLLLVRQRAVNRGSARAARRITLIAAVLVVVNLVEAALPGVFPGWMRVEMLAAAALMAALAVSARKARVHG